MAFHTYLRACTTKMYRAIYQVFGAFILVTIGLLNTEQVTAKPAPLVIRYDAFKKMYSPALPNTLTVQRGQFFNVEVANLNPLYRLKTTQQQIIIQYAVPSGPPLALASLSIPLGRGGACNMADLESFHQALLLKQAQVLKLQNDFHQVQTWAGTTALDELPTKKALNDFTQDFAPIYTPTSNPIPAIEIEAAVAAWTSALSDLSADATKRAAASRCPDASMKQLGKTVKQLAEEIQKRFALVATAKDLPRWALYWTVLRDADYTQKPGPIEVQGDRVLLTIDVVKRDDFAELPPPQWDVQTLTVHAVGFWVMDVSAGVLLNRLRDRTYSLRDSTATVRDTVKVIERYKTIQEQSGSGFRPGVVALLNVRYKFAPNLSVGPSAGLTVTDSKSIVQYHLGGSLLLGDRQRIVLTVGWSWGDVRRIREDLKPGQKVPISMTEVPTRLVFDNSVHFALTYNITSTLTRLVQTALE